MSIQTLKYVLADGSLNVLHGCCAAQVIEEHSDAINDALSEISLIVEIDDDFGFVKILSVNGYNLEQ